MHNKLLVDRVVLEQALVALEYDGLLKKRQAITGLRAALAQEQADGRVVIEQRGGRLYMNNAEIGPGTLEIRRDGVTYRSAERVAVQQPEPAQEPVSWGVDWGRKGDQSCVSILKKHPKGVVEVVAVEYGPPQLPLTDEEIAEATAGVLGLPHEIKVELVRAIERKVRGK